MSIERELLQTALGILEDYEWGYGGDHHKSPEASILNDIRKLLAQPEQEPVVKITSIHADGENLPVVITGVVLSDAVNIWDLPIKNNDLLYLAPPKREPLGLEIMDFCGSEDYREGFKDGALYAEKCHGIGGGE
jgi:hypothetical protein